MVKYVVYERSAADKVYRIDPSSSVEGAQGSVIRAVLVLDGSDVVVKRLSDEMQDYKASANPEKRRVAALFHNFFRTELNVLKTCHGHPNIVTLMGCSSDEAELIMQREAKSLEDVLNENRSMQTIQRWFRDMLAGVGYLHERGIIHTDLKPDNLLLGYDNRVKLCDFGFSQTRAWGGNENDLFLGSLWYLSPELLLGKRKFTKKVDEWALGMIILAMIKGAHILKGAIDSKGQNANACSCSSVYHKNFDYQQLEMTLKLTGSPRSLDGFECANHVKHWPQYPRIVEATVVQMLNSKGVWAHKNGTELPPYLLIPNWVDAIGGLLTTSDEDRVSCHQTLKKDLFSDLPTAKFGKFAQMQNMLGFGKVKESQVSRGSVTTLPSRLPQVSTPGSSHTSAILVAPHVRMMNGPGVFVPGMVWSAGMVGSSAVRVPTAKTRAPF
jgi:serine/threonine protein kinase